jgi:L-lactate dehydrogenase complex protein LldG
MGGREKVLARVRRALADVPRGESPGDVPVARDYLESHSPTDAVAMLAEHLAGYRALVHHTDEAGLAALIARRLAARGARRVVVPHGLPAGWLADVGDGVRRVADEAGFTARELDAVDSVVTGCAVAIAETGTVVLDGSAVCGRRALTLVPDRHVCLVRAEQIVATVPEALAALDPQRPITLVSGPSATSDIELERVEGVHGPRTLEVVVLG